MEIIEPYKARLLEDVKSHKKGESGCYGRRFDAVLIVADHGNVLIAENNNKIRFAVMAEKVQVIN
jgi:hypothetical protein